MGAPRAFCAVKLPVFEGPLDLLLHLIRANEVDVTDIPIALISEQYLEYLELMQLLDIDVAGEYLLMAATLAHIKSRMLLPPDPNAEDDEFGADPRAELARRLAEYAAFKEVAAELGRRPVLGRDVFPGRVDLSKIPDPEAVLETSLFALLEAMRRVLASIPPEERHHEVSLERITLRDRMVSIMDALRAAAGRSVLFEDLLADGELTRHRVVMTFLAILELARIQALRIFQSADPLGAPGGPVRARLAVEGAPDDEEIAAAAAAAERDYEPRPELARGIGPHALLSIVAYSILTLAACQALMFAFQEHRLHTGGSLALLRALPPLATMEVLLFQLLWTGLIVRTASIITGFVFLEDMFAQHVVHHTALSLSSWVIFAILLWGHHVRGWRGVTAIRWTLTGFVLLMLAYFGSKLVIEIILDH